LLKRLEREVVKLKGEIVSIANSSDPYPSMEAEKGLTRESLKILSRSNCRIQIVTKSDLVTRDADLLSNVPSMAALTITTEDSEIARRIEPNAASPEKRLKAVEALIGKGIAVSVRIDPIIPFLNDEPAKLVVTLAGLGVKHVTASTCKMKRGNWQRFASALPEASEKLKKMYFSEGERAGSCVLLPKALRLKLLNNVRSLLSKNGMKFGVCRENLSQLNTALCDGSWLLPKVER
jgi:DNA repair photolyase